MFFSFVSRARLPYAVAQFAKRLVGEHVGLSSILAFVAILKRSLSMLSNFSLLLSTQLHIFFNPFAHRKELNELT